jgi:tetratricopeptide (TPR) repeat protein
MAKLPENPWTYERLVKQIYERLLGSDPDVIVHQRKKYEGRRSRQQYEIDVSFEFTKAGVRFLVLVECKFYSKNVEVGDATEFAYKLEDIGAHKGILVSTHGFQRGVFNVALASGIALVVVRAPDTYDIVISSRGPKLEFDYAFEEYSDTDLQGYPVPVLGIVESHGAEFFDKLHIARNNDVDWASWQDLLNALCDSEPDKHAAVLIKLARQARSHHEYATAVTHAEAALALREGYFGAEDSGLAEVLNLLTGLYEKAGRYQEGEAAGLRALGIRRKSLEARHPDIVTSLNNLATVYMAQGSDATAEKYLRQGLAMIEPGSQQLLTASIECNLAKVCGRTGRESEAETLYKKSLAGLQQRLGAEHPTVADVRERYTEFLEGLHEQVPSGASDRKQETSSEGSKTLSGNEPGSIGTDLRRSGLISRISKFGRGLLKPGSR